MQDGMRSTSRTIKLLLSLEFQLIRGKESFGAPTQVIELRVSGRCYLGVLRPFLEYGSRYSGQRGTSFVPRFPLCTSMVSMVISVHEVGCNCTRLSFTTTTTTTTQVIATISSASPQPLLHQLAFIFKDVHGRHTGTS